jgi:hypothetical protein
MEYVFTPRNVMFLILYKMGIEKDRGELKLVAEIM